MICGTFMMPRCVKQLWLGFGVASCYCMICSWYSSCYLMICVNFMIASCYGMICSWYGSCYLMICVNFMIASCYCMICSWYGSCYLMMCVDFMISSWYASCMLHVCFMICFMILLHDLIMKHHEHHTSWFKDQCVRKGGSWKQKTSAAGTGNQFMISWNIMKQHEISWTLVPKCTDNISWHVILHVTSWYASCFASWYSWYKGLVKPCEKAEWNRAIPRAYTFSP